MDSERRTCLSRRRAFLQDESGGVAVTTAICLIILLGMVALAVDVGHLLTVRNELQNAADASALAGVRALYPYSGYPGSNVVPVPDPPFCDLALVTAANAAYENYADRTSNLAVSPGDVQTGIWDWTGRTFTADSSCSTAINAMKVRIRKDPVANQPVATWFARILGTNLDSVNVAAEAIAAVGFVKGVGPDTCLPLAINSAFRDANKNTPGVISLNPDGVDNAGWASPIDQTPNASNLCNWISNGGIPEDLFLGDQVAMNLSNGVLDTVLREVARDLPLHTDTYSIGDNTYTGWLVLAAIVDVDKFTGEATVVDFQPIIVTSVNYKGNPKSINIVFYGEPVALIGSYGGGPVSNLYATQPRLVR